MLNVRSCHRSLTRPNQASLPTPHRLKSRFSRTRRPKKKSKQKSWHTGLMFSYFFYLFISELAQETAHGLFGTRPHGQKKDRINIKVMEYEQYCFAPVGTTVLYPKRRRRIVVRSLWKRKGKKKRNSFLFIFPDRSTAGVASGYTTAVISLKDYFRPRSNPPQPPQGRRLVD